MVRYIVWLSLLTLSLVGSDAYERNCVECHSRLPMSLQKMFMEYLSVYSGEKNTKAALKHFMRFPRKDTSLMSTLFLKNFVLKKPLKISEKELNEAIDIYWERYKVIDKLR